MADPVRAVLVDLDDTLFDHALATRSALAVLHTAERAWGVWPFAELVGRHARVLEDLHARVLARELSVDEARLLRFGRLLDAAGVADDPDRVRRLAGSYRQAYEQAWQPVPGATELLARLRTLGLRIVVVTNNGVDEQRRKIERTGLVHGIDALVTSEETGVAKPHPAIFEVALRQAAATAGETVMLGDGWTTDIEGARASGIRPVWFNPRGVASPDPAVAELSSLVPADAAVRVLLGARALGSDPTIAAAGKP